MTIAPPEIRKVTESRIACDGGEGAQGHPRVWLQIPAGADFITCPYCDARFEWAAGAPSAHH